MITHPSPLQLQDKIALIAPAGTVPPSGIEAGIRQLTDWGFVPVLGKYANSLYENFYTFSAPDAQRLEDLQDALDNPEIKAIICLRGGYGTTRLLPKLNWIKFLKQPKWLVGFSDITALHAALQRKNIASLHGVMPVNFELPDNQLAMDTLLAALKGQPYTITAPSHRQNQLGNTTAPIVGGNLSILLSTLGTAYEIQTEHKMLFIEEIGEVPYRFDRLLGQLSQSGKLENLAGLVVGGLLGFKEKTNYSQEMLNEMVLDYVQDKNYPVCFDFPVGHQAQNATIICGATAKLVVNLEEVSLTFDTKSYTSFEKLA